MPTTSTRFLMKIPEGTDAFDNEEYLKGNLNIIDQKAALKSEVYVLVTNGSNSNGNYTKLPDGTLICSGSTTALAGTTLQTKAGITYPLAFVGSTPHVVVSHRSISGKFANYYVLDPNLTSFSLVHQGVGGVDLDTTLFTWYAVGKWK